MKEHRKITDYQGTCSWTDARWLIYLCCRCARLVIPASMEATTAIRMLAATTWAISQTLCSDVSANLALLEMDTSVERTLILMAGLMLILCVSRTQPITAKRLAYIGFVCFLKKIQITSLWLLLIFICFSFYRTTAPIFPTLGKRTMTRMELVMLVMMMMTTMAFLMTG